MTILGAVLAGGQARRFGSDKALALLDGRTLLDHALASLAPHVDALVVVGRTEAPVATAPDRPAPGLGPLGGICGVLAHAAAHGHAAVLTTACDTPALPAGLAEALLASGGAYAAEAPVVGLWPVRLLEGLCAHLAAAKDRSVRRWAAAEGLPGLLHGRIVADADTPADLRRLTDLSCLQIPSAATSCPAASSAAVRSAMQASTSAASGERTTKFAPTRPSRKKG